MTVTSNTTLGVEEEFFVVDRSTLQPITGPVPRLDGELDAELPGRLRREICPSQIEAVTHVCSSYAELLADIVDSRQRINRVLARHGLGLAAVATHPAGDWRLQQPPTDPRYGYMTDRYQDVARSLMANGLHVHVAVPDADDRVRILQPLSRVSHLFLALSASSPFWAGRDTGLASYRRILNGGLPRTGPPPPMRNWQDYLELRERLTELGAIPDGGMLWWDVRPSAVYPTVELRVMDAVTLPEQAASLAVLFRAAVDAALDDTLSPGPLPDPAISEENRWRATRYGTAATFVDPDGGAIPADLAVKQLLATVDRYLESCERAEAHRQLDEILSHGTGADRQRRCYAARREAGASPDEAFHAVTAEIVARTEPAVPALGTP